MTEPNPTPRERFDTAFAKSTHEGVVRARFHQGTAGTLTGNLAVMGIDTYERLVEAAESASNWPTNPWLLTRQRPGAYSEWQLEARNGETLLGFPDWLHKEDAEGGDRSPDTAHRDDRNRIHDVEDLPQYTHDCDECVFLRMYRGRDLYFHGGEHATVIARFGSNGPDYISGLAAAAEEPHLAVAYVTAARRGYLA